MSGIFFTLPTIWGLKCFRMVIPPPQPRPQGHPREIWEVQDGPEIKYIFNPSSRNKLSENV